MKDTLSPYDDAADGERDLKAALLNGWRRRCPNCGAGPMMSGFLTVRDRCAVCDTALHHHRADDGPAWATILVTGHLMAPLMMLVYTLYRPEGWVMAVGFGASFTVLSLFLLPRFKGLFVAFQWARRMHGFGGDED